MTRNCVSLILISSPWNVFIFLIIVLFVYISNCWVYLNIDDISEHQDNFFPYSISKILSGSLSPSKWIDLFQNLIISVFLRMLGGTNPFSGLSADTLTRPYYRSWVILGSWIRQGRGEKPAVVHLLQEWRDKAVHFYTALLCEATNTTASKITHGAREITIKK